ncbi:hypothetical protein ACHAXA_005184 [Cyclostephanos tholiformis]|uniref:Thioredoxin domain-containing protein n=1 Tax=Cyclostephanos tholiformis TaxID=382380 RepID=A0ABD3R4T1_9STRA
MYHRMPSDLTETSQLGRFMSFIAMISMSTLFLLETKAYFFSTTLETDLSLHSYDDEPSIRLNFDITMMDLPCELAAVDVYTTVGYEKNVTKNIRKYPVNKDGVQQQYEARNWHQNDIELWDPAVPEAIDHLHKDGEDAISLDGKTFQYALKKFPYLFVKFYATDCKYCHDLAPTWEALGEVVTDTSMSMVDEHMSENNLGSDQYTDEEYETAVNNMAPVLVTKLNCSLNPSICNGQGIRVYPTMRVFVDGEAKGDYNGHRTVMELVQWLSHIEAENREPGELKMQKVVEYANERTVRNAAEREWNDALTRYRSPYGSWNVTHLQGCQLTGHIMVDKAPGKFLIHAKSYGHDIAANMANLSHIVHHFSFGDEDAKSHVDGQRMQGMQSGFVKSLHPMDGNVYVTEVLHQAYHHHLRVIATEFGGRKASVWARERNLRLYRILQNSQLSTYRRHVLPEVNFSYDLSPIAVSYIQEARSWYDYLTRVLAIVGGAFTVIGMMNSSLNSLSKRKKYNHY